MKVLSEKTKIFNEIKNKIKNIPDILSATVVGTFNVNPKFASDLDLVVIIKKLNKKNFKYINYEISSLQIKKISRNYNAIYINNTFGPLKLNNNKTLVIHLMIYDVDGHIDHVINSPFTCYDWERNKPLYGKSLKEIYPVNSIFYNDFFSSRRSIKKFEQQLKNKKIQYQKYKFINNHYKLIGKFYKLNNLDLTKYSYHIISNTCKNYFKFLLNKNIKVSDRQIIKILSNLNDQKKIESFYKKLIVAKKKNVPLTETEIIFHTTRFLRLFKNNLLKSYKESNKIKFFRHFITKFSQTKFLGQNLNPRILPLKKVIKKKNIQIFSSPLIRAIQTAKLISKQKPVTLKVLQEINYGAAEGKDFNFLQTNYPEIIQAWSKGKDPNFPNGENTQNVIDRVKRFLKFIDKKNKLIYVVTHNVFLRCVIGIKLSLKIKNFHKIIIPYGQSFEIIDINNIKRANIDRKKILIK